jgi:hypothetical protein
VRTLVRGLGVRSFKKVTGRLPKGFYTITPDLNPNFSSYLAINTGFPNAYDQANARTGQFLMIHGDCYSAGAGCGPWERKTPSLLSFHPHLVWPAVVTASFPYDSQAPRRVHSTPLTRRTTVPSVTLRGAATGDGR